MESGWNCTYADFSFQEKLRALQGAPLQIVLPLEGPVERRTLFVRREPGPRPLPLPFSLSLRRVPTPKERVRPGVRAAVAFVVMEGPRRTSDVVCPT